MEDELSNPMQVASILNPNLVEPQIDHIAKIYRDSQQRALAQMRGPIASEDYELRRKEQFYRPPLEDDRMPQKPQIIKTPDIYR